MKKKTKKQNTAAQLKVGVARYGRESPVSDQVAKHETGCFLVGTRRNCGCG